MDYFSDIGIVGIAVLIILDKLGILNKLLKRKNSNGIEERLKKIECNDLSHIDSKLDRLIEITNETLIILKERLKND